MLIDVHAHIAPSTPGGVTARNVVRYASMLDLDFVLIANRDGASEPSGAADLDEADVNGAALVAGRTLSRMAPLYWVRPGRLDSDPHAFRGALETEPFVGAAFSPAENGFDAAASVLDPYLEILRVTGRAALFCVRADARASAGQVYELARRHPTVPVVMCICGAGETQRAGALDALQQAVKRKDADLYLDTSHAEVAAIVGTIRSVGADRVVFGTDALSYGEAHSPRHIALLDALRGALPRQDYQRVTGENAARLFRLTVPTAV